MKVLKYYVDGGNLGKNPSPEGVYWSVGQEYPDGTIQLLTERATTAKYTSNNDAEYLALIDALGKAAEVAQAGDTVRIHSDSQLIVYQFNGKWSVGEERLRAHRDVARQNARYLLDSGVAVEVVWVRRAENVKRLGH